MEYYANRPNVISTGEASHERIPQMAREVADGFRKSLDVYRQYRWVEADRWSAILDKAVAEITALLKKEDRVLKEFATQDPVEEQLSVLFTGKVGNPYAEMHEVYERAERRLQLSIPPGFKDAATKKDFRRYGDVVLWFQLLDFAKSKKNPIVLVTGDSKVDWWLNEGSKTAGPRPELVQEMFATSGVTFHMYSPSQFIEHAQKILKPKRKAAGLNRAIEELREVESEKLAETMRSVVAGLTESELNANQALRLAIQTIGSMPQPSSAIEEAIRQGMQVRSNIEETMRQFAKAPSVLEEAMRQGIQVRSSIEETMRQFAKAPSALEEAMHHKLQTLQASPKVAKQQSPTPAIGANQRSDSVNADVIASEPATDADGKESSQTSKEQRDATLTETKDSTK
ncbi:MAG TPA: PIN-like domain-containing protein [Candidatus Sulfotelmatobacter sp.]